MLHPEADWTGVVATTLVLRSNGANADEFDGGAGSDTVALLGDTSDSGLRIIGMAELISFKMVTEF